MKRGKIVAAALVAAALGACEATPPDGNGQANGGTQGNGSPNANGGSSSSGIKGQLVFFSGRPAPEWTIPDDELDDLRERLDGLAAASEPASFPRFGGVAYFFSNPDGAADLPDEVLVQDGIVEVQVGSSYSYFSDDKDLEGALRTSSIKAGAYAELGLSESP